MKLSTSLSKIHTAIGGLVLSSLMVGFLCISFVHSASPHANMGMSHAAHNKSSVTLNTCCDAGVNDHMELWKNTLVGIPKDPQSLFVLFLFVGSFVLTKFFRTPRLDTNILFSLYKQYAREHLDIGSFDSLRLALSKGILNPKLF